MRARGRASSTGQTQRAGCAGQGPSTWGVGTYNELWRKETGNWREILRKFLKKSKSLRVILVESNFIDRICAGRPGGDLAVETSHISD
jgi:hypothetical protein